MSRNGTTLLSVRALIMMVVTTAVVSTSWGTTLSVLFLDVGQGDAVLVDYGEREMLIDGGRSSVVVEMVAPLVDGPLDVVLATHGDVDAIGGLTDVLGAFEVTEVWTNGGSSDSDAWRAFTAAVTVEAALTQTAKRGEYIPLGDDVKIEVLAPDWPASADNASVALLLTFRGVSFLLTGDIAELAETDLLSRGLIPDVDVLKIAHHGSAGSSSPAFVAAAKPEVAIYSAASDNTYGFPAYSTLESLFCGSGARIYGTDVHGTVAVEIVSDREYVMKTETGALPRTMECVMELATPTEIVQTVREQDLNAVHSCDWYKVYLAQGVTYVFGTTGASDTIGEVHINSSSGDVVAKNDDASGRNFSITYSPQSSAWYFLRVSLYANASGTYAISYQAKAVLREPPTCAGIRINEIESNPAGDDVGAEWVELYNCGPDAVDIGGWSIWGMQGKAVEKRIALGTVIGSGQWVVVTGDAQWLDNEGETVELRDPSGNLIDRVGPFSDSSNNSTTYSRTKDGSGAWTKQSATRGQSND